MVCLRTKLLNYRYQLLAIDGSDFNLSWSPHSTNVCDFSKNKPYRQMHVNVLYDLQNQTYRDHDDFNMIENCNWLSNCHYLIRTRNYAGINEIAQLPYITFSISLFNFIQK